ncbi:16S rRNA (cytidine(1402)-2'-O)-methyltransferase [Parvularcula maris]|uniref:Ribosomal RNA small subunit methyltransferase I n=1 Tax=Parvularcula maris TaxID=2965077 RepID=A0A9X2RJW9_9PROT|nr:16S rRNA (cytidine(1402)-2'-O)-methyltransferase [Parvularcula maris]MCQ8186361.1 16S rRNA (cytidine(1402)-2'-O)-methyltransferase [Parvularcula maris]
MSDRAAIKPLSPGLHVVATPIGNLGDMTRRAVEVLTHADLVLCEDTRVTGKLLSVLGIPKRPLLPYHEHNAEKVRPQILAKLEQGGAVALVSDAGTPLISDPGYRIVREARDEGHKVFTVPGPSALTAALSIAGAPTDRFSFFGFVPKGQGQREKFLGEALSRGETVVVYETGPRLASTLQALGPVPVSICRELTKLHEEVVEGTAAELAGRYAEAPPNGEIVLVIHPTEQAAPDLDEVLAELMADHSVREASKLAAEITGLPKKECYARALALRPSEG